MLMLLLLLLPCQEDLRRRVALLDADGIEIREEAERVLMDSGEPVRPLLQTTAAEGRGEAATRATRILRWLDLAAALPPRALFVHPELRTELRDPNPLIRRRALYEKLPAALQSGQGDSLIPVTPQSVLRAFLHDPDPALRAEAATDLAHDFDGLAAELAFDFLSRYGHPDFGSLCGEDYEDGLRVERACERIRSSGRSPAASLKALLRSATARVRQEALETLRRMKAWEAEAAVRALLEDPAENVVLEAMRFLKASGNSCGADFYEKVARERESYDLLREAAETLVRLGARAAVPRLLSLASEERHARTGAYLFHAAVQLDPAAAAPEALKLLREGSKSVRYGSLPYAIEALGRLDDTSHSDLVLRTLDSIGSNLDQGYYSYARLLKYAGRCIPRERAGELLDRCLLPAKEPSETGILLPGLLKWVEGGEMADACLRRLAEGERSLEQRTFIARLLGNELEMEPPRGMPPPEVSPFRISVLLRIPALCDRVADRTIPTNLRGILLEGLPWRRPAGAGARLGILAREILGRTDDPLRDWVSTLLVASEDKELRGILRETLAADDSLPVPNFYRAASPRGEEFGALLLRRLESKDPGIVTRAADSLQVNGPCGLEDRLEGFLRQGTLPVRRAAASWIRKAPRERDLIALREALRKETHEEILRDCLDAVRILGDREGLTAALAREFSPGTVPDRARLELIARLGTREEILALEPRLADAKAFPPRTLLPALVRVDAAAGRRFVARDLTHSMDGFRAVAAEAIGAGRLVEFLPALRAMSLTETVEVRRASLRALGAFDRDVWLPAFRALLRQGANPYGLDLETFVIEKAEPQLAKDVHTLFRQAEPSYRAGRWAQGLDACVNGGDFRSWSGAAIGRHEIPDTLGGLLAWLKSRGVKVEPSKEIERLLSKPLGSDGLGERFLGPFMASCRVQGEDWRDEGIPLIPVSIPGGFRLLTLKEAGEHWNRVMGR